MAAATRPEKLHTTFLDKLGTTFLDRLGTTPNEKKVIVFLLLALIAGVGIRIYAAAMEDGPGTPPDYTAVEKEFKEKAVASIGATPPAKIESTRTLRTFSAKKRPPPEGTLDLNTATMEALMSLPGIGEATARAILVYREKHGPFTSNEQLMDVRGIGQIKYRKLKPFLRTL